MRPSLAVRRPRPAPSVDVGHVASTRRLAAADPSRSTHRRLLGRAPRRARCSSSSTAARPRARRRSHPRSTTAPPAPSARQRRAAPSASRRAARRARCVRTSPSSPRSVTRSRKMSLATTFSSPRFGANDLSFLRKALAALHVELVLVAQAAHQAPARAGDLRRIERQPLILRDAEVHRAQLGQPRRRAVLAAAAADAVEPLGFVAHADLLQLDARAEHRRELAHERAEVDALLGREVERELLAIPLPLGVGQLHDELVRLARAPSPCGARPRPARAARRARRTSSAVARRRAFFAAPAAP